MKKPAYTSMRLVVCLLSGSIFVTPAYSQKRPDFYEIVPKLIEKIESDSFYVGENYTHQELEITEELKNGVVTSVEHKLYQVEKRGHDLFKKLLARNDIPENSEFQKKKEIVSVGTKLLGRFDFSFERSETVDGEKCWVFSFRPKANLPTITREDRVLNQLTGETWIAQESLNFKKLASHLLTEVKYEVSMLGSGGRVNQVLCTVIATTIDGRFAVKYVQVEYVASGRLFFATFINKHVVKKINYQNYERRKQ